MNETRLNSPLVKGALDKPLPASSVTTGLRTASEPRHERQRPPAPPRAWRAHETDHANERDVSQPLAAE
eukprot:6783156-Pyramimonas_sp.AAC.1